MAEATNRGRAKANVKAAEEFEESFPDWMCWGAVLFCFASQLVAILLAAFLLFFNTYTRMFQLAYFTWIYIENNVLMTYKKKGKRSHWLRGLKIWRAYAAYFPITLHKTADLSPHKYYMFGYHPHGIIGMGAWGNFSTEATGFSTLFPGITPHLMGLNLVTWIPFTREPMQYLGVRSVGKTSIKSVIGGEMMPPGQALIIAVGGAREALDAIPGTLDLTLLNRAGFVKQALMYGCSLVPVISFGENELFDQVNKENGQSMLRSIQVFFMGILGFSMPLFYGNGLMPYRQPIDTVVGVPIDVPKIEEPSAEDVRKYHNLYVSSLRQLYDANKTKFFKHRKKSLALK